nr:nucleotide pyrophosphohydrolase [Pseudaquidulcibacter saccharophilus]
MGWEKFHNPKDLSLSIVLEASELLEKFQWLSNVEISIKINDEIYLKEISDEIADVMIYLIYLSDVLKIDLLQAVVEKHEINKARFNKGHS